MPSRAWLQTAITTVGLTGVLALLGYIAGASFELRLGLPNGTAVFSLETCLREGAAFLFSSFSLAAFMAFERPAQILLALLVVGCAAWSARFLSEPARRRCTRILAVLALIAAGGKLLVLDFPLTAVENLLRRPLAFPPPVKTGRIYELAIHRLALSAFEAEYFSRLDKDLRPAIENFVATKSRVDKREFVRRARRLYAVNATMTLSRSSVLPGRNRVSDRAFGRREHIQTARPRAANGGATGRRPRPTDCVSGCLTRLLQCHEGRYSCTRRRRPSRRIRLPR